MPPSIPRITRLLAAAALLAAAVSLRAQTPIPPVASVADLTGSITTGAAAGTPLPLSLDDAVRRGLKNNLQTVLANQDQTVGTGERLLIFNALLPDIRYEASRSRDQFNLEALGFTYGTIRKFPANFIPPSELANFNPLVTANVVQAQATLHQTLFNLQDYELYKAAKDEIRALGFAYQSARGGVIQQVGDSYMLVLADSANVDNAKGLLAVDKEILRQATLSHQAGVSTHLDELRAQVQYQQQEQIVIARENMLRKDKVALKREIGLPADQAIILTDATPFADIETMPLGEALRQAYINRQEYLRLNEKVDSAKMQSRAAHFERFPTLSFTGNYGVTGLVGGVYHGTFLAQGTLSIPIFREAKLRGDRDVAEAQLETAQAQRDNFRTEIEAQIRDSLLDVNASRQMVTVARSNVDLANASLNDTTDRFRNGVADDLPVVQAQAALADAQAELVNSLYQYNVAKLGLARSIGVIDRQFHAYLGLGHAPLTIPAQNVRGD